MENDLCYPKEASRAVSTVVAMNCLFLLSGSGGGIVAMGVYLDESGTHDDSEVVAVSAVYAEQEVWERWTYDWIVAKQPIRVFHSNECNAFRGEFKGWDRGARDDLVKDLLSIIGKHHIKARVGFVHKASFAEAIKVRPDVAELFGDPYFAALQWALGASWIDIAKNHGGQIAFVHETNDYGSKAAEQFMYIFRKMGGEATFTFGRKDQQVPLQCADILAYEANKQHRAKTSGARKPLVAIDPLGVKIGFNGYGANETADMAAKLIAIHDSKKRPL